jgi:hypothetical protein
VADEPSDRVSWGGRNTPALTDWFGSWRKAGWRQATEVLLLIWFLYWVAPEQLMSDRAQFIGAVFVALVLMPLVDAAINVLRAPSTDLQRKNKQLTEEIKSLRERVSGLEDRIEAEPCATVNVIEERGMVYVAVRNDGPLATFHAMFRATGVADLPQKELFGRWDAVFERDREIARGTTARIRVAKAESIQGTFQWRVYFFAMKWMEKMSEGTTFHGSNPPTDDWGVPVELQVIAKPDLRNGPIPIRFELRGDGSVRPLASDM